MFPIAHPCKFLAVVPHRWFKLPGMARGEWHFESPPFLGTKIPLNNCIYQLGQSAAGPPGRALARVRPASMYKNIGISPFFARIRANLHLPFFLGRERPVTPAGEARLAASFSPSIMKDSSFLATMPASVRAHYITVTLRLPAPHPFLANYC